MQPLSVREAHERLCEAEAREDLLQFELDGWCVWPLFRAGVAAALSGAPSQQAGRLRRRVQRARLGIADGPRLFNLPRATYFAKSYTSGLLDLVDGRYRDIWLDDTLLALGDYCKVDALNNAAFLPRRRSAAVPPLATTEPIDILARSLALVRPPAAARPLARDLAAALTRGIGWPVLAEGTVRARLANFHWRRRLYRRVLRRVGANFAFVADSGEYALVAAAKESRTWACEFQHGIIDRHHSGYVWTRYAVPFLARMPVPDRLFLFGQSWRDDLDADGFWGDRLRVVGSPRIDRFRSRLAPLATGERLVVWTSQGIDVEQAIRFVRAALRHLPADLRIRIVVKLHPIYDGGSEAAYCASFADDPRVEVRSGTEEPSTFELLSQASLHISVSSACHYDALALGVPTVVLPLVTSGTVMPLVEAGYASLAANPEMLASLITNVSTKTIGNRAAEQFFAHGALRNIRRELIALSEQRR
jgi:hypothetical protein